ncbi:hypothetical protein [Paenibacillus sp. NEAU-GSW1]|uniref:hypothetical protein n=1 Tax=Paenibacillus sp. NEAU-GSW1 TaxID=2682486 RepID=UPI0012E14C1C|nr:hypothetical protein [Paenibacillus sp. NEAU-GSW1]MUT67515.1 hypothetical protein [Paenibacillus sp. NEAU-GSW1]
MGHVTKEQARRLVGKNIYAVRKDGTVVKGKLVRVHNNQLVIAPLASKNKGKKVQVKFGFCFLPLLFLFAIGTCGFGGGFGGGYGGGYGGSYCGCGCGGYNKCYNQGYY